MTFSSTFPSFGGLIFLLLCSCPRMVAQHLVISEASLSNTLHVDADGDTPDWIELHNPTGEEVLLAGWRVGDRPEADEAWRLPELTLPAGGYLLLWASGKDRRTGTPEGLHTDFRLSSAGETVYLFSPAGTVTMVLSLPQQRANISRGYSPAGDLVYYDLATPGAANPESSAAQLITERPAFSHPGGETGPFLLTFSAADAGAEVRYTSDGTRPTATSPRYETGIYLDTTTVIRARIFRPGALPGPVKSATFVIGTDHQLPVMTLAFDPEHFFDPANGIYVEGPGNPGPFPYLGANYWQRWERPVELALYNRSGVAELTAPAGVRIFGGNSRTRPQRSLSLFARRVYGDDAFSARLFPSRSDDEYQAFVLRNSGNDWRRTMLRDAVMTGLMTGSDIDYQAYRPVITYLNGEYWGIYNLREKVNEHFLAARHGLDPDEINLLELDGTVLHGNDAGYPELVRFFQDNDLRDPANYAHADSLIDLDNLILYNVVQVYFGNTDWPHNNVKFWRPAGGRWRWILFDTDYGFGHWDDDDVNDNTLAYAIDAGSRGWPNQERASLFLREVLRHEGFRHRFVNQFADELNSRFLPAAVTEHLDSLSAAIAPEITDHYLRWNGNPADWAPALDRMYRFGEARPAVVREDIMEQFSLAGHRTVTVENETPERGAVQLNSLRLQQASWSGEYFAGVPIRLAARAEPGYRFVRWVGDTMSFDSDLVIDPTEPFTVRAIFREAVPASQLEQPALLYAYPNPSAGELLLEYVAVRPGPVTIEVHDLAGRFILSRGVGEAASGLNIYRGDYSVLDPGAYLVSVRIGEHRAGVSRWVRQ